MSLCGVVGCAIGEELMQRAGWQEVTGVSCKGLNEGIQSRLVSTWNPAVMHNILKLAPC